MKFFLKRLVVVVAASLLTASLYAEEGGGSVSTPIGSGGLGGYVDSTGVMSYVTGNSTNVPPAYRQWLIGKRQAALNGFNQEHAATHGYWGNTRLLQSRLMNYHLVPVSRPAPPLNPIFTPLSSISGSAYFDSSSCAYFDAPSLLSGPGGTYLMPDLRIIRVPR